MQGYGSSSLETRLLPEAAAWQSEEAQHCQKHPERQQREDVQEGVQAQEEAKDHQLRRKVTQQHLYNSNNSALKKTKTPQNDILTSGTGYMLE